MFVRLVILVMMQQGRVKLGVILFSIVQLSVVDRSDVVRHAKFSYGTARF